MNILVSALMILWLVAADAPGSGKSAAPPSKDGIAAEYEKLLEADEAALEDVEKFVKDSERFEEQGAPGSRAALAAKIDQRLQTVEQAYEDFLMRNPKHVEARLAYGSFLNETGNEEDAIVQWEKAREIDPKNPAAWNNLANIFGHIGPVKKAFQ